MNNKYKLGSLFDGSGGFPLAGSMCGIEPVWASEVEPYPIAVTRSRFPAMKHLGDITKINGAEIEPVDIVCFGSPCQDLSVAGLRKGLRHEANGDEETTRSGLFLEAVRIIKEMRDATNGVYPRFALWENVPGAFSSNGGEDFRIVLEELIKIVEPAAVMPAVPTKGWPYSDSYSGDGWSLAYRVFDAQYWGVPQRRRRIHLVIDFRGECAREVLFERKGVRGYFAEGGTPWQGTSSDAENGAGADDREGDSNCLTPWDVQSRRIFTVDGPWPALYGGEGGGHGYVCYSDMVLDDQGGQQINVRTDGKCPTLRAEMHGNVPCVLEAAGFKAGQGANARSIGFAHEKTPTLAAEAGGNSVPSVCIKCYDARGNGDGRTVSTITGDHEGRITDYTCVVIEPICCIDGDKIGKADRAGGSGLGIRPGDKMYTLTAKDAGTHAVAYGIGNGQANQSVMKERTGALNCMHDQQAVVQAIVFDKEAYQSGQNATGGAYISEGGPAPTLRTTGHPPGVCVRHIVRRLTPTECARLQGFADRWGDIDPKEDFTDDEYRFWCEVYLTKALIDGTVVENEDGELYFKARMKPYKHKTKPQMLKWYNKLRTDSSEYKMWGNGIALPPALYCMQGIVDALEGKGITYG